MRGFYMGAKLRWLMESKTWPEQCEFQDMVAKFQGVFRHGVHRHRFSDALVEPFGVEAAPNAGAQTPSSNSRGGEEKNFSSTVYLQLLSYVNSVSQTHFSPLHNASSSNNPFLPDTGEFVSRVTHLGVSYATYRRKGLQSSFILFRMPGAGPGDVVAGQIDSIFYHTH